MVFSFKKYITKNSNLAIFLVMAVFASGIYFVGYELGRKHLETYLEEFRPLRRGWSSRYQYINPLVGIDSPNAFTFGYHTDIEDALKDLIKDYQAKGLMQYAIYYRALDSAVWFGFNENEVFFPASLLKTTIALAAYKQEESEPGFLKKPFLFTQQIKDKGKGRINDGTVLVVGNTYTVQELVKIMLDNSDNSARDLLTTYISADYIVQLYQYLGINEPLASQNFGISIANYALFFRMLYSATFLYEDHSETILSILTKTDFSYGVTRDIPKDLVVAHKYGVFNLPKDENGVELQELHECGIVYDSDKPYLICVMTKGTDQNVLADFIARVSKVVYDLSRKD